MAAAPIRLQIPFPAAPAGTISMQIPCFRAKRPNSAPPQLFSAQGDLIQKNQTANGHQGDPCCVAQFADDVLRARATVAADEIGFVFRDVVARELDAFISENILFELGFSSEEDRRLKGYFSVELDSAMGSDLCGRLQAKSGEVIFARPSQPEETNGEQAGRGDGDKPSN